MTNIATPRYPHGFFADPATGLPLPKGEPAVHWAACRNGTRDMVLDNDGELVGYVNGEKVASVDISNVTGNCFASSRPLSVGASPVDAGIYFLDGRIDSLMAATTVRTIHRCLLGDFFSAFGIDENWVGEKTNDEGDCQNGSCLHRILRD